MKEKTLWQQWEAARQEGRLGGETKQALASLLSKAPALRLIRMKFCDYRCFPSLSTTFDHQLTVFHGGNGRGKSSVLEAAAKALSWAAAGMTGANDRGSSLSADDVRVPAAEETAEGMAEIEAAFAFDGDSVTGVLRKSRSGAERLGRSEVLELQSLGTLFRTVNAAEAVNRPLFLYFPTDRSSWYRESPSADEVNRMTEALSEAAVNRGAPAMVRALKEAKSPAQFWGWLLYYSRRLASEKAEVAQEAAQRLESAAAVLRAFWPAFEKITLETDTGVEKLSAVIGGRRLLTRQFSDGERMVFFLLGEIAWRLMELNPRRQNPLEGDGIVLIDEIELHLHPQWQQKIIGSLCAAFPNVQFILTTHSPQVISTVRRSCLRTLPDEMRETEELELPQVQTRGRSSNDILEQVMGTPSAPSQFEESRFLEDCQRAILAGRLSEAQSLYEKAARAFGKEDFQVKTLAVLLQAARRRQEATA